MFSFIFNKKNIYTFKLLLLLLISVTNCTKDADNLTFVPASINSISPNSGPGDTEVTITGIAFNADIDKVSVFFNNVEGEVTAINSTEIKAIVPRGAMTGTVRILINGEEAIGPEFNYMITPAQVTTLIRSEMPGDVDGPAAQASFGALWGLLADEEGTLFISDYGNNKVRKIDSDGVVSTVTGMTGVMGSMDGTFAEATFDNPRSMVADADGNIILVDIVSHKIRKINFTTGSVETIAGTGAFGLVNGASSIAQFSSPISIAIDPSGNLYIGELGNAVIRKITPNNMVSTLTGTGVFGFVDGAPDVAQISIAAGMAIDPNGDLVFTDSTNDVIRKVTPTGVVSTIAGTGIAGDVNGAGDIAQFNNPLDMDIDSEGNIFVVDFGNNKIKKITPEGIVSTHAGTGEVGFMDGIPSIATFNNPRSIFIDENDIIYVTNDDGIRLINPAF